MVGTWWSAVGAAVVEERIPVGCTVTERPRGWDQGSAANHEDDGRRGLGLRGSIAGWLLVVRVGVRRRRTPGRGRPWDCSLLREGRRRLVGRAVDSGHTGRPSCSGTCIGCMVLGSGRGGRLWVVVVVVVEVEIVRGWGLSMGSEEMLR